ncbi:MAG: tyrosine-type recombinase/integrase [Brevinema sp.]
MRETIYSDEIWLDIQRLASKDKDFLLYLQVLYYTGCRLSELISLHRKDIDTNGSVRILKDIPVFQNKTKLKKTITIPAFLVKEMKQGYIFEGHNRQPEYYPHG